MEPLLCGHSTKEVLLKEGVLFLRHKTWKMKKIQYHICSKVMGFYTLKIFSLKRQENEMRDDVEGIGKRKNGIPLGHGEMRLYYYQKGGSDWMLTWSCAFLNSQILIRESELL